MKCCHSNQRRNRAFTLIELLVVIAITAILMTLILFPVIQSMNLTRAAQAWADAQDKARTLTERIAREVNNMSSVRDNSGVKGELDLVVPAKPGTGAHGVVGYDSRQDWIRVPVFNAKLDLVKPFEGDPSLRGAGGAFVNPYTGLADPTLRMPMGQVNLPAAPGMTIVRYWIGLRDPMRQADNGSGYAGYIEPYTGLLEQQAGIRDNLYVLYRAEVQPMIWSKNQGKFVVNKAFFYDLGRFTATKQSGPYYDDPSFFDPTPCDTIGSPALALFNADGTPKYDISDPDGPDYTKAEMVQHWLAVATIQTEVSRFDMIQPVYDKQNRQAIYDGDAPRLLTLIQFHPSRISAEPARGEMAARLSEESEGSNQAAPDVFVTKYPGWSNTVIRTYRNTYDPTDSTKNAYEVGIKLPYPGLDDAQGLSVYGFNPAQGFDDTQTGQVVGGTRVGAELFDTYTYKTGLSEGYRANFTRGMLAANSRSGWLSNQQLRDLFEPYVPDYNRGRAVCSWSISEVGACANAFPYTPVALTDPVNNPNNLPGALTWPDNTPALTPMNDTNVTAGTFSDSQYSTIDKKFNKLWNDYPGLRNTLQRFIDLRVTPNDDGAPSPLNPDPTVGFSRARIVPGSEQVFAPDQNLGPNYGRIIRYSRTTHAPGPNQYRINYTDLAEPDYTLLGLTPPPPTYTPTDLTSAVFQPRYKVGYIEFNSDPNVPLPNGKILVYYRFQFTQPNDVMSIDYDSRQLMGIDITIRDYPQANIPNPQSVTLHAAATARNFLR